MPTPPTERELQKDIQHLTRNFHEWREANAEDRKGMYKRLTALEQKAIYIPNQEESDLIKEAASYYRSKRELREKLTQALLEKGLTGVVLFVCTALIFYFKHLFTE